MKNTTMEKELERLNPEWFACYKQTEEIVMKRWLPGITQWNGSYNTYPHIRGVIEQVDTVVYSNDNDIDLNASELYILLNAILFHDIGRIYNNKKEDHGKLSGDLVQNNWGTFKIISEQTAKIIAYICKLHNCEQQDDYKKAYQSLLSEHFIDQFGIVRGKLLGVLLYLGDHLDGSFNRTLPKEINQHEHFRSKVLGIRFLPEKQLICTVLNTDYFIESESNTEFESLNNDAIDDVCGIGTLLTNKMRMNKPESKKYFRKSELEEIYQDVYRNDLVLDLIRNELNLMSMPIDRWLIECDGHLFRVYNKDARSKITKLTVEPLLCIDYCKQVIRGMYNLSGEIFAKKYHTYYDLSNVLREDPAKVNKIKIAVNRLASIAAYSYALKPFLDEYQEEVPSKLEHMIYYDDKVWSLDIDVTEKDMKTFNYVLLRIEGKKHKESIKLIKERF